MTAETREIDPTADVAVLPADLPRVLILMIDHHLGNVVIALPVIQRLASYFRGAVDVMVDERYAALVRLLPSRPRVLEYPQQSRKRRTLLANLRPAGAALRAALRRYSAVIDVGGGTRSATTALLSLSRRRIGLKDVRRSWMYSRRIDASETVHYFDRYSRLLRFVGQTTRPPLVQLHATAEARAGAGAALARAGRDPARPLIIVHVGAGDRHRIYPPSRFAAVADRLVEEHAAQACVIGAPSEQDLMDEFLAAMTRRQSAFAVSLPLEQLLAAFEQADLIISNEGGPTHLAAATDLPIVTLFGPSREANWRPVRERDVTILRGDACDPGCRRSHCIADLKCLMRITPDDIVRAAETYLMRRQRPSTSA